MRLLHAIRLDDKLILKTSQIERIGGNRYFSHLHTECIHQMWLFHIRSKSWNAGNSELKAYSDKLYTSWYHHTWPPRPLCLRQTCTCKSWRTFSKGHKVKCVIFQNWISGTIGLLLLFILNCGCLCNCMECIITVSLTNSLVRNANRVTYYRSGLGRCRIR